MASMSFCSRQMRQSAYCLALENFLAAAARGCSCTSHMATTFSFETPAKCSCARWPVAISAILSLLLGASAPKSLSRGRISVEAPKTALALRNWRRLIDGAEVWGLAGLEGV